MQSFEQSGSDVTDPNVMWSKKMFFIFIRQASFGRNSTQSHDPDALWRNVKKSKGRLRDPTL